MILGNGNSGDRGREGVYFAPSLSFLSSLLRKQGLNFDSSTKMFEYSSGIIFFLLKTRWNKAKNKFRPVRYPRERLKSNLNFDLRHNFLFFINNSFFK